MVKKFLIIFLLVASGSIPFFGLAHAAEKHIIKFATLAPEGSTWMRTMRGVESIIKEKSRGDVGFRVYPGGVAER
jgi:TRAP-type C4-dicarboxylate transport system substrate-binding protein